jgi:trimeric autotransporter adhesin
MLSGKKKLQLVAAFATLFLFAVIVGCNGFFVDPVLTSIAVGPTATINQGATVQESAVGTYNDGSTKTLSSGVQWSSSDSAAATVTNAGLVTGTAPGSATITAAYQTTSGTSAITVSLGNVTALKITPLTGNTAVNVPSPAYFAYATVAGSSTPVDVSPTATWTTTSSTVTINVPSTTGVGVTFTDTVAESVTIQATYTSTTTLTATATLTVN